MFLRLLYANVYFAGFDLVITFASDFCTTPEQHYTSQVFANNGNLSLQNALVYQLHSNQVRQLHQGCKMHEPVCCSSDAILVLIAYALCARASVRGQHHAFPSQQLIAS